MSAFSVPRVFVRKKNLSQASQAFFTWTLFTFIWRRALFVRENEPMTFLKDVTTLIIAGFILLAGQSLYQGVKGLEDVLKRQNTMHGSLSWPSRYGSWNFLGSVALAGSILTEIQLMSIPEQDAVTRITLYSTAFLKGFIIPTLALIWTALLVKISLSEINDALKVTETEKPIEQKLDNFNLINRRRFKWQKSPPTTHLATPKIVLERTLNEKNTCLP